MCLGPHHPRTKEGPSTLPWSSKNYWGKKVTVASSVDHAAVAEGSNEVFGLICHEFKPWILAGKENVSILSAQSEKQIVLLQTRLQDLFK